MNVFSKLNKNIAKISLHSTAANRRVGQPIVQKRTSYIEDPACPPKLKTTGTGCMVIISCMRFITSIDKMTGCVTSLKQCFVQ